MTKISTYQSEYGALCNAIHRCHNPDHKAYPNYGGRGISVADEWRNLKTGFDRFLDHIGPKPTPDLTLDRIDNDLGYLPGNVRWADRKTQQNNRRRTLSATRKLSPEQVLAIYADPRSPQRIADEIGVTRWAIRKIKCGETWRWLTEGETPSGTK